MKQCLAFLPLLILTTGCPVTQRQDAPAAVMRLEEPQTKTAYSLYVPSNYSSDRDWPLVVTLHGTYGWDGSRRQIKEWKYLAEQKEFLVVAPDLKSVQGILPVHRGLWYADLDADEEAILTLIDELSAKYRIDPQAVLLTGFSAGGYPLYHVGLRRPERFNMLIARGCNSSVELFERIELTDAARKLPIRIFWGKDDPALGSQSWQAVRWLGEHGFRRMDYKKISGGHLRRPDVAYRLWRKVLPERHRR